jgi:hypothetical protein
MMRILEKSNLSKEDSDFILRFIQSVADRQDKIDNIVEVLEHNFEKIKLIKEKNE